jgi:hypothetical protein
LACPTMGASVGTLDSISSLVSICHESLSW